jgi:hypothetical protein
MKMKAFWTRQTITLEHEGHTFEFTTERDMLQVNEPVEVTREDWDFTVTHKGQPVEIKKAVEVLWTS